MHLNGSSSLVETLVSNQTSATIELHRHYFLKALGHTILFLISVINNSLTLMVIQRDKRLKTTNNFLIANMAVSDLLSTVFLAPTEVWRIYYGNKWFIEGTIGQIVVKLVHFIPDASTAVSFYSCLFIAIDRYLAVARPLRGGFSKTRLKFIIPGIWIFSGLILSPYFVSFQLKSFNGSSFVFVDANIWITHFYILLGFNFGIPVPIIATLYGMIIYKLRHHQAPGNQTDIEIRRRQQQNRKILKMSITIVSLLTLSWGYFSIVTILSLAGIPMGYHLFSAVFLAHMTYTFNFFIYLVFNNLYRENVKAMLSKICKKCYTVHRSPEFLPHEETMDVSLAGPSRVYDDMELTALKNHFSES